MKDFNPKEFKVVALRECPVPDEMKICEQPQQVVDYWRMCHVFHFTSALSLINIKSHRPPHLTQPARS
jgi:hypothetical protein